MCGIFLIPVVISVVLTCTTGVPHKYHRGTTGHFLPQDYHTVIGPCITTEPVWYIFHSCGTYLYNRDTTQKYHRITTGNFKRIMYHRITTEPVWYIFHSCGNFCGTHLYHTITTGHLCTTGLPHNVPQNLRGIFFIPVVISVVLDLYNRGTTQIPQDICVPQDYHTNYHRACVVYFSFLW